MRAAIYARYSSSGQREESIEGQVRECTAYAEKCGYDVVRIYADKALTGTTDKRPEFQRMISDGEKGLFDILICWKIDRFARNRYDSAIYKNRLHKAGVSVQYARETISEGAEGIILESVLEGFAEYYSANLAENVKRGNYESMTDYKTMGKKYLGLKEGESGRFIIDQETAPAVKWIFEQYAAGVPTKEILHTLKLRGIKNANGEDFNRSSLARLLKNERYAGVYIYAGFRVPDVIPAIVPRDLFDAVQARAAKARHAPKNRNNGQRYLLTGKLFCGHCGSLMTGESADSKTGSRYYYYTCRNHKAGKCDKKREPKEATEKRIIEKLIECVHDDDFINEIADAVMEELEKQKAGSTLAGLEKQEATKQKEIENMYKAIAAGLNAEKAVAFISGLEGDLQEIRQAIAEEKAAAVDITRDDVVNLLTSYRQDPATVDQSYITRLIDSFLAAVYLYDNDGGYMLINAGTETKKADLPAIRQEAREACLASGRRTPTVCAGFVVLRI